MVPPCAITEIRFSLCAWCVVPWALFPQHLIRNFHAYVSLCVARAIDMWRQRNGLDRPDHFEMRFDGSQKGVTVIAFIYCDFQIPIKDPKSRNREEKKNQIKVISPVQYGRIKSWHDTQTHKQVVLSPNSHWKHRFRSFAPPLFRYPLWPLKNFTFEI